MNVQLVLIFFVLNLDEKKSKCSECPFKLPHGFIGLVYPITLKKKY